MPPQKKQFPSRHFPGRGIIQKSDTQENLPVIAQEAIPSYMDRMMIQPNSGLFNHNFRTLIIDAAGHLQMVFPIGGDLSDAIVSEILKGSSVSRNKRT